MDIRYLIRVVRAILVLAAVALAAIPLLLLLDLANGGTGYGMCPGGLAHCRSPYTAGPELSILLILGLIVVLFGLRVINRTLRRLDRRPVSPSAFDAG